MKKSAWGSRERRYVRSQNKPWLTRLRGYKINEDDMSKTETLVERLRDFNVSADGAAPICDEAADSIAELEATLTQERRTYASVAEQLKARIAEFEAVNARLVALAERRRNEANSCCIEKNARIAEFEAERDKLQFALEVIRAGETLDPRRMAADALSDPSGE